MVGWYHSHPVFLAQPSLRDIENQINYQRMFRDAGGCVVAGVCGWRVCVGGGWVRGWVGGCTHS